MAFRLDKNRSVSDAVPRIVRKQAAKAVAGLDPKGTRPEGIHVARTSLKRLRGLLRLLKPELGSRYRDEERLLRKVQRELGPLRDAQVLVETFDEHFRPKQTRTNGSNAKPSKRNRSSPARSPEALDVIRVALEARALSERLGAGIPKRISDARSEFKKLRGRADRLVPRHAKRDSGFGALERGLESIYRRARTARDAAYAKPSSHAFHDWRKAVKYHGYHLKLLCDIQPEELGARLRDTEKLGALLGKDHDLAVLAEALETLKSEFADDRHYRRALDSIAKEQASLRKRAKPLGDRVFVESPAEFRNLMRTLFLAWRESEAVPAETSAAGQGAD